MGFKIDGVSGNTAAVDAANNLSVVVSTDKTKAGFVRLANKDADSMLGIVASGRAMVASDSLAFYDPIDGATINLGLWTLPVTTMTIAQTGGYLTLNSGASVASAAVARIASVASFPFFGRSPIMCQFRVKITSLPQSNSTGELGFGTASGTTAPTDGAFFRWKTDGTFIAVLNNNGTEVTSGTLTSPSTATAHAFRIENWHDSVFFYVDDVLVSTLGPTLLSGTTLSSHQPLFCRVYNSAGVGAAPKLELAQAVIMQMGGLVDPMAQQLGKMQRNINLHPQTFAQLATINHGTAASTLTANTAPAIATPGGDFVLPTTAGAVSEFPLFAYQVPTGLRAIITGIRIDCTQYGAATATTAEVLQWYLGTGCTAASLATADNADGTTLAVRRLPVGTQVFPISATIGTAANVIEFALESPMVVESGRFIHIILSIPIGTATASELYRGTATLRGYME